MSLTATEADPRHLVQPMNFVGVHSAFHIIAAARISDGGANSFLEFAVGVAHPMLPFDHLTLSARHNAPGIYVRCFRKG